MRSKKIYKDRMRRGFTVPDHNLTGAEGERSPLRECAVVLCITGEPRIFIRLWDGVLFC